MPPRTRAGTGTNQEAVRRHNLGTLLRHVHRAGRVSRAELTAAMGLNRSTIAALVSELESLGVLEQGEAPGRRGESRPAAGRPSAGVALAPDGPFVVAVDLWVDRITVARAGLGGVVQRRAEAPLLAATDARAVGAVAASLIAEVVGDAAPASPLVGVGIAVPGMVRRSDGVVRLAPNLDWHEVSFGAIVVDALRLDLPVALANDADLGALAEHRRGIGMGIDDLVYVSGNVGVGAGVVVGGVALAGAAGYAGEVGHLRIDPSGRPCHCGSRGCWETEVGARAIAAAIHRPVARVAALDRELAEFDAPTPELCRIGHQVGRGLASLVNVLNPEMVVLGGYFRALHDLVGAEITAGMVEHSLAAPRDSVVLAAPGLGSDSVLLGAVEMAFEPLLLDPVGSLAAAPTDVRHRLALRPVAG